MDFILIYHPSIRLVGPFNSPNEATNWGREWQDANGDNPCWQRMTMTPSSKEEHSVKIEAPYFLY